MSAAVFHPAVIEMKGVSVAALRDASMTVVADVNWSVQPGEFWVVAGQQHSGKSDLLMLAAGLTPPLQGNCRVLGCDPANFGEEQLPERLRIGFVFAGGQLFSQLTVAENVALPLRYQKNLAEIEVAGLVTDLLELLELAPYARLLPSQLAANWRQRAALARALILKPELLLLDQPLAGLGSRHQQWWLDFLDRIWRGHPWLASRPMTLIVTTDALRPWAHAEKKYAVLHGKSFSVAGTWPEVASARDPVLHELLAETSEPKIT